MKPSFRKRFFAWGMKQGDEVNHLIYGEHKKDLFKDLSGIVVEVGPGTGINFRYFPSSIIEWIGIEPNEAFSCMLMTNAKQLGLDAKLVPGDAANIPLNDNSVDAVICTLVLCSVDDPQRTIAELKRILKPGGKLIFIEHVASPSQTMLRAVQNLINPLNKFIADGCNCNRETWHHLEQGGFSEIAFIHYRMHKAFAIHAPHVLGYVVK
jgi:ubiquinone/menaquinone biosynthesis C-methylase UbiE